MIEALIDVAETRGFLVRWHRGGPKAAWVPAHNIVSLRIGMDDAQTLCSLAHELGHAHYGDPPGHAGWRERRADKFAARILIDPDEYRSAELTYGPSAAAIAHELGVTKHVVEVWREMHADQVVVLPPSG